MKANWKSGLSVLARRTGRHRGGRVRLVLGLALLLIVGGLMPVPDDASASDPTRMELFSEAGPFERQTTSLWRKLFLRPELELVEPEPVIDVAAYLESVPHGSIIYEAASEHEVDPLLVLSVVEIESRFRVDARSEVGAVGLMQLMPATGAWMGAEDLLDPIENIFAGTRYLKYLEKRFEGDLDRQLAAYNAGEGTVMRYGGIPPYKETRRYIARVLSAYDKHVSELENLRATDSEDAR